MKKPFNVKHALVLVAVGFIMLSSVVFVYTALIPVDVLKNWTLSTDNKTYTEGDVIILTSVSEKLMSVNGTARRYIECKAQTTGSSWYRTPVNEVDVDRQPGKTSTASRVQIPNNIQGLPNTCRLYITVEYRIYYYRSFTEFATTNEFQVLPLASGQTHQPQEPVSSTVSPDSDGQVNNYGPSVTVTEGPKVASPQTDVDEPRPINPTYTPPNNQEQPGLVQQLVESVTGLVKTVI
jgi:hypothetical protein